MLLLLLNLAPLALAGGCEVDDPGPDLQTATLALQETPGYCPTGLTYDTPTTVATNIENGEGSTISVAGLSAEDSAMVWTDKPAGGASEVYLAVFDETMTVLQGQVMAEYSAKETEPSVSAYAEARDELLAVAWRGRENGSMPTTIHSKTFTRSNGGPLNLLASFEVTAAVDHQNYHRILPQVQALWPEANDTDFAYVWLADPDGSEDASLNDYIAYTRCDRAGTCTSPCAGAPTSIGCVVNGAISDGLIRHAPRVDAFRDRGGFVVVWSGQGLLPDGGGVSLIDQLWYRRYDGAGQPLDATPLLAVPNNGVARSNPDVAVLETDRIVVTWQEGPSSSPQVFFRVLDYLPGTVHVGTTPVRTPADPQRFPRVAAQRFGDIFAIAWMVYPPTGGDYMLRTARFTASGGIAGSGYTSSDNFDGALTDRHDLDTTQCSSFVQGYHRPYLWQQDVRVLFPSP